MQLDLLVVNNQNRFFGRIQLVLFYAIRERIVAAVLFQNLKEFRHLDRALKGVLYILPLNVFVSHVDFAGVSDKIQTALFSVSRDETVHPLEKGVVAVFKAFKIKD